MLSDLEAASSGRGPINTNTIFKKTHRGSPNGMKNEWACMRVCVCVHIL